LFVSSSFCSYSSQGNFGNVILQEVPNEDVAVLVAIDNAMTGIRKDYGARRNQMYDVYLEKVKKLLTQVARLFFWGFFALFCFFNRFVKKSWLSVGKKRNAN
jgi:hypothetical protein